MNKNKIKNEIPEIPGILQINAEDYLNAMKNYEIDHFKFLNDLKVYSNLITEILNLLIKNNCYISIIDFNLNIKKIYF